MEYIFSGFYSQNWWLKSDDENPHDCTVEQLETAIQGYFTADALPLSISDRPGISGKVGLISSKPWVNIWVNVWQRLC